MRRFNQLTRADREFIAKGVKYGLSVSEMARTTGVHKSTISRELKRNRAKRRPYMAGHAQDRRNQRQRSAIENRKASIRPETQRWIQEKLRLGWSPEQIAGRSAIDGPQRVSHEYVYRLIIRDKSQGGTLFKFLRSAQKRRYRMKGPQSRVRILNRVDISMRPKIVEERKRLGDLEGDLLVGRHQRSYVVVVADRLSRLVGIERVLQKNPKPVNARLKRLIQRNGRGKTLTLDNGCEFASHQELTRQTGVPVYFAHAYAAWERGTVENTNRLLRQYLPKKTDFRLVSDRRIREIELSLNNRPRKCLGYLTPNERHYGRRR